MNQRALPVVDIAPLLDHGQWTPFRRTVLRLPRRHDGSGLLRAAVVSRPYRPALASAQTRTVRGLIPPQQVKGDTP